mgnify:CR=1 FL=1
MELLRAASVPVPVPVPEPEPETHSEASSPQQRLIQALENRKMKDAARLGVHQTACAADSVA